VTRERGFAGHSGPLYALLLSLGFIASCASALRHPDAADANWARQKWAGASLESLEDGRARYVEKCAGCHQLHQPNEFGEVGWKQALQKMQSDHDVELTAEQVENIYRYLVSAGRAPD